MEREANDAGERNDANVIATIHNQLDVSKAVEEAGVVLENWHYLYTIIIQPQE
jgi:hypothetical protein